MATEPLDASRYTNGTADERIQFARDFVSCLSKVGYAKLRNHGISSQDVRELFSWAGKKQKAFFDLPHEKKMSCVHKGGTGPVRGFNSSEQEKSSKLYPGNGAKPGAKDALESLNIGPLNDTTFPNQWPADETLPAFRQHIESAYMTLQKLSNTLFQAIELGLGLSQDSLLSRAVPNVGELRLNHYPSIPACELLSDKNTRRIWPHTDFGTLSLLFQDSAGGLEFEDRTKPEGAVFLPVTSEDPADLIVTVADILQRWTNDVMKAGLHRVNVPREVQLLGGDQGNEANIPPDHILPDRYSMVFFSRPSEDKSAGPIQDFVSEDRPASYEDITALEYLARRNRLVY